MYIYTAQLSHLYPLRYSQFLYIDLYWPVWDSDHALFVSLFAYLFYWIYRGSLRRTLGKNSTSCLDGLWEHCPLFHVCRPYWKPFVAPGNKQIHFLLARLHFVSFFSIFNISSILDSVVAPSNKNSISC